MNRFDGILCAVVLTFLLSINAAEVVRAFKIDDPRPQIEIRKESDNAEGNDIIDYEPAGDAFNNTEPVETNLIPGIMDSVVINPQGYSMMYDSHQANNVPTPQQDHVSGIFPENNPYPLSYPYYPSVYPFPEVANAGEDIRYMPSMPTHQYKPVYLNYAEQDQQYQAPNAPVPLVSDILPYTHTTLNGAAALPQQYQTANTAVPWMSNVKPYPDMMTSNDDVRILEQPESVNAQYQQYQVASTPVPGMSNQDTYKGMTLTDFVRLLEQSGSANAQYQQYQAANTPAPWMANVEPYTPDMTLNGVVRPLSEQSASVNTPVPWVSDPSPQTAISPEPNSVYQPTRIHDYMVKKIMEIVREYANKTQQTDDQAVPREDTDARPKNESTVVTTTTIEENNVTHVERDETKTEIHSGGNRTETAQIVSVPRDEPEPTTASPERYVVEQFIDQNGNPCTKEVVMTSEKKTYYVYTCEDKNIPHATSTTVHPHVDHYRNELKTGSSDTTTTVETTSPMSEMLNDYAMFNKQE